MGLQNVIANQIPTIPCQPLLDSALQIAINYGRSFYDCLYVALAESSGIEFVTADEKLVNSLAARYPIKWIGTF
jgi:predicted nucleic acid-binding protein